MPRRASSILLAAALAVSGCRTSQGSGSAPPRPIEVPEEDAEAPIRLTLVATNDIHGWAQPQRAKLGSGVEVEQGGMATFAGYVKILREANPGGVILVDAGDLFQGTLAANLTEGAVIVDAYNQLGYAAAALGNHEFDYGPEGPVSVAQPGMDPFGALKLRLKQARFPMMAVNVYDGKSGERPEWLPNDGTTLLEVKGVKVGLFGLITPSTPAVTSPVNVASLRFGSLVPEATEAARRLRARGAELVIALVHAGGKCAAYDDPKDLSSCDLAGGEIFEMLEGMPPGTLDAVVAGHTHSVIGHFVRGTPVVQSFGLGRFFGTIDLFLDRKSHAVLAERTRIQPVIPICARVDRASGGCDLRVLREKGTAELEPATFFGKPVVQDPKVTRILAPVLARVEQEQRRKLGVRVPEAMGRHYEAESALGSFLADSLREMERADVALLNSGGLRADLPAGEITYGDVFEVIPFDNTVATLSLTGEELKRLLQAAYGARKGVFQVSGIKVKISRCPGRDRLRGFTLSDGRAVQPEKKYRLVVPDFLARGGDGLGPVLSALPPARLDFGTDRELNLRDSLVAFWQKRNRELVAPKLGRIAFVDDGAACTPAAKLDGHTGHPSP